MADFNDSQSLRQHPRLAAIFKAVESRHPTPQELDEYRRVVPECQNRADAAQEVAAVEMEVVNLTLQSVFSIYPYEEHHQFALAKCTRDVRYVSAYATLAMLMRDEQWLKDKLLYWLKTILQAFEFPDRATRKKVLFGGQEGSALERLNAKQRSIYETYVKLRDHYRARLSPAAFLLMEPHLQAAIDILSAE